VTGDSLTVAVASRAYPGEEVSGDAWTVESTGSTVRLAVFDGLGHGPVAAAAAAAGLATLRARPELDPLAALRACHAALRATRGAAVSIASVDLVERRLVFAGVGNVEARVWTGGRVQRPIAYRGIVGSIMPSSRAIELELEPPWALMMYSDGVSSRLDPGDLAAVAPADLQAHADSLIAAWGRASDDVTLLLARPT
jgi:serine phosphatase RsbU (regulator of sigma subunit)